MGKYKKYKNRIEKFLSGDSGKRFFNFAYSIGAAIVILGAYLRYCTFREVILCCRSVWG